MQQRPAHKGFWPHQNKKRRPITGGRFLWGLLGGLGDFESQEAATITTVRMNPGEFSTHDAEIESLVLKLDAEEFGGYAEVEHG
jgi:hypothetical protein